MIIWVCHSRKNWYTLFSLLYQSFPSYSEDLIAYLNNNHINRLTDSFTFLSYLRIQYSQIPTRNNSKLLSAFQSAREIKDVGIV